MTTRTGAQAFCDVLEAEGVDVVFGLPGTQTVMLYEALRHSRIRAVVPTHELGAAFMAYGYARASGKVGVLLTIPGPGFAFAPAGIAEAKLDGVPVVHFTLTPSRGPTGEPAFQALDQQAIARPLVKAVFRAETRAALPGVIRQALREAVQAEAGPVFVEMTEAALRGEADDVPDSTSPRGIVPADDVALDEVVQLVKRASHPVMFVASECTELGAALSELASSARIPVFVPSPHRGVLAEDHPWMLCCDDQRTQFDEIKGAFALADLVIVLGTRLTHIATAGFRLKLPVDRLVCVSESGESLPHGYQARITLHASIAPLLKRLRSESAQMASTWQQDEVRAWQQRFSTAVQTEPPEPVVNGDSAATFFAAMRSALPRDAIVFTDSGLHQALVRRHFPVLGPTGLVFPCELQSMGFGLPAAIGAKLAQPGRVIVVVMGDGGFAMSGLELLTAMRGRIPVVVVVFNDGKLNLIRLQQLREFGVAHGAELSGPDFERMADAMGVGYQNASDGVAKAFQAALASKESTLIEVIVGDSTRIRYITSKSYARESVRRVIGPRLVNWLKRRLR